MMPTALTTAILGQHCHWTLLPPPCHHSSRHDETQAPLCVILFTSNQSLELRQTLKSYTACWLLVFIEGVGSYMKGAQALRWRLVTSIMGIMLLRPTYMPRRSHLFQFMCLFFLCLARWLSLGLPILHLIVS